MTSKILFCTAVLYCVCISLVCAQHPYNEYSDKEKQLVFYDNFESNVNNWFTDNKWLNAAIENGTYTIKCKNYQNQTGLTYKTVLPDENRDFEIETALKILNGNGALVFGMGDNYDHLRIELSEKKKLTLVNDRISEGKTEILFKTEKFNYLAAGFNKLTFRKLNDSVYLFVNEQLIYKSRKLNFWGKNAGFSVAVNSTVSVDYLKISYITGEPPTVQWITPVLTKSAIYSDSTNLQVCIRSKSALSEIKIVVNDTVKHTERIFSFNKQDSCNYTISKFVKLKTGDNILYVQAQNKAGTTLSEKRFINSYPGQNPDKNEKRLALIFGNSDYSNGNKLKNPQNDAVLLDTVLRSLGFDVILKLNASKSEMEKAIREFSKKLPNYNIALFYFAGHGVQVNGENFLIPVDAILDEEGDVKFEAVSVNFVAEEFEKYPNNVNVLILDACRNNPFRAWKRGGNAGFVAIPPSSGTIISFATSEGSTAADGSGSNGLFTQELVQEIVIHQPIESVFKNTRVRVEKKSKGTQSPQEWSKLKGEFYFKR